MAETTLPPTGAQHILRRQPRADRRPLRLDTPPSRRAFGYCRVSTDQQSESGISLDEQERKIEARSVEMGWSLEPVFVDAGVSGGIPLAKRPAFNPMVSAQI